VTTYLLGIVEAFKDKLNFKQALSRNLTLQKNIIKMYTMTRD